MTFLDVSQRVRDAVISSSPCQGLGGQATTSPIWLSFSFRLTKNFGATSFWGLCVGATVKGVSAIKRRRTTATRRTSRSTRRRYSRTRGTTVNVERLIESVLDDAVSNLGLDLLDLTRQEYVEMLKPIIEGIASTYSRPSKEAILARLRATVDRVYMMAAAYLLEKKERISEEQLEFIVSYGGPALCRHVQRIYNQLRTCGRDDLIGQLRLSWERYCNPTPIPCPRCGFRALTPDLICMVCGYEASEEEVKKAIDFEQKIREFVEMYDKASVEEAMECGYVLVGETVKPPSAQREPYDIELRLSKSERELIKRLLSEKKIG